MMHRYSLLMAHERPSHFKHNMDWWTPTATITHRARGYDHWPLASMSHGATMTDLFLQPTRNPTQYKVIANGRTITGA
jgi:hypothetical protein